MLRYAIRRILYMIPTVFGVILITFFLFNVVGGDPAMMKLGKQASPLTLEAYDVQRGFDKPLIVGRWGRTRAFDATRFHANAGAWGQVAGAVYTNGPQGHVRLAAPGAYAIPLAFPLRPDQSYRWNLTYRLTDGGRAFLNVEQGTGMVCSVALEPSQEIRKAFVTLSATNGVTKLTSRFEVESGTLEVYSLSLGKRFDHGLDTQFFFYLKQLSRLDFGVSQETNQRVSGMIFDGLLPSLALATPIFLIELMVSIALALFCAFFRNTLIDRFFVVISVALMSVNYLVWIVFGQYVMGYLFRWFPIWGFESFRYLILPCIIGVVSGLGGSLRFYRTVMLDEMYRDYVRTAFAKGVSRCGVLFKHVLKNAMIPILTSVIMTIPFLYTGSLLLESFFGIPGLGRMGIEGINSADIDVIRALVLVGAVIYVVANLITDLCYALADPRVRLK